MQFLPEKTPFSLDDLVLSSLRLSEVVPTLEGLLGLVSEHVDADEAFLWLGNGRIFFSADGMVAGDSRMIGYLPSQIARGVADAGDALIIRDRHPRSGRGRKGNGEFASGAGVPLELLGPGERQLLGTLSVVQRRPREWDERDLAALRRFAAIAAAELSHILELQRTEHRTELARHDLQAALGSAPLFRTLVERSLVGIAVIQDDRFTYANPQMAEIFGYTPDQMMKGIHVLDVADEEDRPVVAENLRKRLSGEVETIHYRFSGLRRDGTRIRVEVKGSSTELNGRPAVVTNVLDVTDQERVLKVAEDAVAARDEVLAIVSHDLRNTLNSIQISAEMLLDSGEERRTGNVRALQIILRAAGQMNILIQDLLDISSIESGLFVLAREHTAPSLLMMDAQELLRPIAEGKGVELEVHVQKKLPPLMADAPKLSRVISNLVGNAIKFTKEGGNVVVSVDRMEDRIRFRISDSGVGIDADQLPHVFDRFWQARPGDRRGTGLGLAIAKGIVEAHGGTLRAESVVGKGTTFTFDLPIDTGG